MSDRKHTVWVVQPLWVQINKSPRTKEMMVESTRHCKTKAFTSRTRAQDYFQKVRAFEDLLDDDYWYKDSCLFEAVVIDGPYIKSCSRS